MGRNVKDVKDVNLKLNYLNVMLNVKDDANNCLFWLGSTPYPRKMTMKF